MRHAVDRLLSHTRDSDPPFKDVLSHCDFSSSLFLVRRRCAAIVR